MGSRRLASLSCLALVVAPLPAGAARPQVPIDRSAAEEGALLLRPPDPKQATTAAVVTPLSAAETAALLGRLEPLPDVSPSGGAAPALRPPTPPPDRAGPVHPITFVAPAGKPVDHRPAAPPPPKPLPPPAISPHGQVPRASEISVHFDQPMVPVARVGMEKAPPAVIAPPIAGSWRWIDTRVLVFSPAASRLPGATAFVVTVPAGTRALGGATLPADAQTTFATDPVQLAGGYPQSEGRSDTALGVRFDQAVDPVRMLPFLRVTTGQGKPIAWKTVSAAEARASWVRNPALARAPKEQKPELDARTVFIAPARAWRPGSQVKVRLKRGAPSAEGARLTDRDSFARFAIAPEFTVKGVSCGDRERPVLSGAVCPASGWLDVEFSNAIDPQSYRASQVQIAGEKFEDGHASGSAVGRTTPERSGRSYQIAIGDGLVDVYGQPLVGAHRVAFTTGPERYEPQLQAPAGLQVLDPRFEIPQWVVEAEAVTSVRVQLYRARPEQFFAYQDFEAGKRAVPPGAPVLDRTYEVGSRHGGQIRVDLRPALAASGPGHVIAVATAVPARHPRYGGFERRKVAWIQVTRLALSARVDHQRLSAWVHDITPARLLAPVRAVATSLVVEGRAAPAGSVMSDAAGHLGFDLPPHATRKRGKRERPIGALLLAASGADSTFVALDDWQRAIRTENALWYVTDDRFTYKPGEKASFKGWLRWTDSGTNPDLALPAAGEAVAYTLEDARGTKLAAGSAKLSAQGGFHLEVDLPRTANLGPAQLKLSARDARLTHLISLEEFRTPAFAVDLNDDVAQAGAAPLILGESIEMSVSARYYAGGGLPGAAVQWDARLSAARYRPPGWDDFDFSPPWKSSHGHDRWRENPSAAIREQQTSALSPGSSAAMVFGLTALPAGQPSLLSVDATITDLDRTSIRASSRAILVHPSAVYVGLRLQPGHDDVLEAVVTDVDGNPAPDVPIRIEMQGVLGSEQYRDDARPVDKQGCTLRSARAPVTCAFKRTDPKLAYTAMASVADARGRRNAAKLGIPWFAPAKERADFELVPDKEVYRPGDVAKLTIVSTVLPATAVVTFARQGMMAERRLELTARETIVELPIEPAFIKNVHVVVDRWGERRHLEKGSTLPLPEHTAREISLAVDAESARLSMRTWPQKPLVEPGQDATFQVEVKRSGKPVAGAEVALMVVDEAVLALAAKSYPDPLEPFYRQVQNGTAELSTLDLLADQGPVLANKPGFDRRLLTPGDAYGVGGLGLLGTGDGGTGLGGRGVSVVKARKDFRATAAFSPLLATDANGRVALTVKMPDSLTRFRVVALAAADTRYFGKAESAIVTQRTVNARTIAPRFLTQGDAFSLPVLVQNLDSRPRTIDVAVRAANLVGRGPAGQRVTLAGGQRGEVRFDFTTRARGRAVVQTIVTSDAFADASNVELPVYEPATTEAFATYGTVDQAPRFEQLTVPGGIFADVGGVEVELASTQLQSLTDAYWYLYRYPYECAEQRSARMLATAAVEDILDLFETPGRPTREEIRAQRTRDLRVLAKDQLPDGGWGYFRNLEADPFVTTQVLQALVAVHATGAVRTRAVDFVSRRSAALVAELARAAALPAARPADAGRLAYLVALDAEALTALAAAGEAVRPRAEQLHALAVKLDSYPIDAKARLLSLVAGRPGDRAMRAALTREILAAVHETASAATVMARYQESERLLLVSSSRTSALALDALMRERPHDDLIPKLARGLLDGRQQGRWVSTQENLAALRAIRRYFDAFEKTTPDYTGKLWVGEAAYAEQAFAGRRNDRASAALGWGALAPGSTQEVALEKAGAGRMYYRVGIRYAPRDTHLPALDAGFIVRRSYTAVDDPSDVSRLPDGRIKIRLGARVLVGLEVLNTTRRFQVALVDPLPAGFETVNETLATSERAAATPPEKAGLEARWDFTNLRDERSEAFALQLVEGTHRFSYTVRAKTPGTFVAAPARAEEMYAPETFGRSDGQTVVIE